MQGECPMKMESSRSAVDGIRVLRVTGRLDAVTSSVFESELVGSLRDPGEHMMVDLSGVDYLSSAGLRALIVAARAAGASGRELALVGIRDTVMQVLATAGFDTFFRCFPTDDEALRNLNQRRAT
jgi:anti-sigma B factor antagonist